MCFGFFLSRFGGFGAGWNIGRCHGEMFRELFEAVDTLAVRSGHGREVLGVGFPARQVQAFARRDVGTFARPLDQIFGHSKFRRSKQIQIVAAALFTLAPSIGKPCFAPSAV